MGKQHLTQEKRTSQPVQCLLLPRVPWTPPPSSLAPGAVPTCQLCSAEISAFPTYYTSNEVPTYSCRDQLPTPALTPAVSFPRRVLWPLHWKPLFHPCRLPTSSSAALGLSWILSAWFTCVVLCTQKAHSMVSMTKWQHCAERKENYLNQLWTPHHCQGKVIISL